MTRYNLPDAVFTAAQERAITEARRCQANTDEGNCPACGDPSYTCSCDLEPVGTDASILIECHNTGDHSLCYYSI